MYSGGIMDFWIPIGIAVVLICAIPFLRVIVKRIAFFYQIKVYCKKRGLLLIPTHPFWFWAGRNTKKCDFYIESLHQVYAVKMFYVLRKNSTLIFRSDGKYSMRYYLAWMGLGAGSRVPFYGKTKRMTVYDFRYQYKQSWELKTPRNILLVYPVCRDIRLQPTVGGEKMLGVGDMINGMEFFTLSHLFDEMERDDG